MYYILSIFYHALYFTNYLFSKFSVLTADAQKNGDRNWKLTVKPDITLGNP